MPFTDLAYLPATELAALIRSRALSPVELMRATLGRIEDLRDSGQLERLLRSGARFAAKAIVVNALAEGTVTANAARRIGPALVFERLWEETGCRAVIEDLAGSRKHGFPLERAVFLTVLHRLFAGGSDRAADRWRNWSIQASKIAS